MFQSCAVWGGRSSSLNSVPKTESPRFRVSRSPGFPRLGQTTSEDPASAFIWLCRGYNAARPFWFNGDARIARAR